jgi:hypothetical protein
MKAENLAKLMLANCLTKKGEILSSDFDMLYHLIYFPKAKKRTFSWHRNGRICSARDTHNRDINVLTKLGVDYGYFNDAPKGGQSGNYLIITEKGYRRIKPFLVDISKYSTRSKNNVSMYEHLLNCIKKVAKLE